MTRDPLESVIEKELLLEVRAAGGLCLKLPALLYRGIPDRLVLLPRARVFFIELKRAPGARTLLRTQIHQINFSTILCTLGFIVLNIQGKDQLREFVNKHLKREDLC